MTHPFATTCPCADAMEHAAHRYFLAEQQHRRRERELLAENRKAEAEGARKYAEWAHRAAIVEVRNPAPEPQ